MKSKVELILVDPDLFEISGCSSGEAVCVRKTIEGLLQNGEAQTFCALCVNPSQASWVTDATSELAKTLGPGRLHIGVADASLMASADVCFLSVGTSGATCVCDYELKPEHLEMAMRCATQRTCILASPHFVEQAASDRNPYPKSRKIWSNLASRISGL